MRSVKARIEALELRSGKDVKSPMAVEFTDDPTEARPKQPGLWGWPIVYREQGQSASDACTAAGYPPSEYHIFGEACFHG